MQFTYIQWLYTSQAEVRAAKREEKWDRESTRSKRDSGHSPTDSLPWRQQAAPQATTNMGTEKAKERGEKMKDSARRKGEKGDHDHQK